ncbi:hypothetical protein AVEN_8843-1 [Araneus ventricosus]|uniref:Uncharacterized protein n=1 Tax=Araneus ventricosus TaxID=182803 RepID=A0A4Y2NPI9_ARAVE|nr:hypothetical protein AVEN_8843-1 [Araneus ventricosus]
MNEVHNASTTSQEASHNEPPARPPLPKKTANKRRREVLPPLKSVVVYRTVPTQNRSRSVHPDPVPDPNPISDPG